MNNKELTLKHATVLFTELEDKGYGRNITIDVTDDSLLKSITDWTTANGIKAKIKDYTNKEGKVVKQFQIKLSKFIKISGKDASWTENNLGYNAIINMILTTYSYDNKFGKGLTACASNIFIVEPAKNSKMDSITE